MEHRAAAEPKWRQLQDGLDILFGNLKTEVVRIEYKPQFAVRLLEMPAAPADDEHQ